VEESLTAKTYYLYIMTSLSGVLYVGITNNLIRRVYEHKNGLIEGFTKKYKCHLLVYFEESNDVKSVIEREKQIKNWNRSKKENLINRFNPEWKDLSNSIN
jgi:putative endonuclease